MDTMEFNITESNFEVFNHTELTLQSDEHPLLNLVYKVSLVLIFVIGTIGNFFVCFAIARKKQMRTSRNLLLLSLAVGDLFMIFAETLAQLSQAEPFGFREVIFSCSLLALLLSFSGYLANIQVAIPLAIHTFYPRISKLALTVIIAAAWASASALAAPNMFVTNLITMEEQGTEMNYCIRDFADNTTSALFELAECLLILIPINILLTTLVIQKIVEKKQLSQMLVLLVVLFLCCSILMPVLKIFQMFLPDQTFSNSRFQLSHLFLTLTVAYKPILYVLYDKDFKREFKAMFKPSQFQETYEL